MRYFLWLLKFALFVVILSFAVKNTDTVSVRYYLGQEWQAPLVLVLLVFFCLGVAVGIMASLGHLFRQRRQIATLKSELRARGPTGDKAAPSDGAPDMP
ncbi:MAG TPA: LapA family protein [Burkholderiales bacterium]|nr:LapA family protein [Burkholderiales bacterium]